MKATIPALLVLSALVLASCVKDVTDSGKNGKRTDDKNSLAFTLTSGIVTRSADETTPVTTLSIPLGDPVDGHQIYLEESVTTLDGPVSVAPETRGTPVYTQNFAAMFDAFSGAGYAASGTTLTPVVEDGAFVPDEGKWVRYFPSDPYGDNTELFFFFRAPKTMTGVSGLAHSINSSSRCIITFHYDVPLDAKDQQDLLFSGRPIPKAESHKADILFHHALTGIKFAAGNTNTDDVKTYITKVEFPYQLFKSADISITTSWENGKWKDDPDIYSSAGACSVSNGVQLKADEIFTVSFEEEDIVTFENGGSFESKGKYADSFAAAGNVKNLNDKDATKTFWLIPQRMNNNIVMDITFHVVSAGRDSGPITRRVEIGRLLTNSVTWRAGELRTYTLKAELVDVDITDKVEGFVKKDVVITNTGNVDSFIRAHIVANWFGYAGSEYSAAVGYADETADVFLPAWKMSGTSGDNFGGVFENLPGDGWVRGADGFFYYTQPVPPGHDVPSPLFTKYSISGSNIPPRVWYLDPSNHRQEYTDVELVMDIPVQAIEAEEGQSYRNAWNAAINN